MAMIINADARHLQPSRATVRRTLGIQNVRDMGGIPRRGDFPLIPKHTLG